MATKHWKFHDYDMHIDMLVRENTGPACRIEARRYKTVYSLTNLPKGSLCLVYSNGGELDRWTRKTRNEGMNGSTRYITYSNLDEALRAGVQWARRKDEEAASEQV